MEQHSDYEHDGPRMRRRIAFCAFVAIAAFFLWTEHRAHLLGALPYLLVLACPIMHLFHHGHGRHRGQGDHGPRSDR
jgi:hypothetical protein